jgi:hypothetical protein
VRPPDGGGGTDGDGGGDGHESSDDSELQGLIPGERMLEDFVERHGSEDGDGGGGCGWNTGDESDDPNDVVTPATLPPPLPPPLPAPMPSPPEVAAGAAATEHGGGESQSGPDLPRFDVFGPHGELWGYFKWDKKEKSLNIHCRCPDHGPLCRMNRSVIGSEGKSVAAQAKGRAVGQQLAWLAAAWNNPGTYGTKEMHDMLKPKAEMAKSAHMTFEKRSGLREWAATQEHMRLLMESGIERLVRPGEPQEPKGLA